MAYSDMELAYLLTAYGEKVYALALERTNSKQNAEEILQRVFLELVNFPPAFEGEEGRESWLMKRTEKLCKAYQKDLTHIPQREPLPEEVEDETLALMKEARDHEGILQRPLKKWRAVHTVLASIFGFVLVVTVTLAALLSGGGKTYTDEQGSADGLLTAPSTDKEDDNTEDTPPKQEAPDTPPAIEDPLPPEIINDSSCVTFTALSDFAAALEQKTAPGYGKTYYNTRALLLLPSRLPDGAVFRCLYLYPESGDYTYSFRFEYQKTLYLLDFKVDANLPATAMEVSQFTAAIREETAKRTIKGTTLTCAFGEDLVTATLTAPKSEEPIDPKIAKKLFSTVTLERCSADNPFLQVEN